MRLGEMLLRDRLISEEQLESALRAQVIYGGRLGTNLVELSLIDLEGLSRVLADKLGVPAALQKHFDQVDTSTLALVPARLAEKHQAIPLGLARLAGRQLVVAFADPTHLAAVDEIGFVSGARVKPCVAPELRILFYLEKFYGVQRKNRFLRIDAAVKAVAKGDSRDERRRYVNPWGGDAPSEEGPSGRTRPRPPPVVLEIPATPSIPNPGPIPPVRDNQKATHSPPPYRPELPSERKTMPGLGEPPPPPAEPAVTARFAAVAPPDEETTDPAPERPALTAKDAVTRIGEATTRDAVGDAVVDYLRSGFVAGLLLICKEGMALGWKGFAPGCDGSIIESVALPLGPPSMFKLAHDRKAAFRGAPPSEGATLQQRFFKLLQMKTAPTEVLVTPVALRTRVVSLVYAHTTGGPLPAAALGDVADVAAAAAVAFRRLIQAAKQK